MYEFLQNFGIIEVDKSDLYSNKNAKFLMYRYNPYLESTHQFKKIIRHTQKVNNRFSLEKLQSVNWQYFIEQIMRQVDKLKQDQIYDGKSSYMLYNIESNFKISRRIDAVLYQDICQNFQEFLHFLGFDETQTLNLDMQAKGGGLFSIGNYPDTAELLQAFDLFYYINRRFPYTTGILPIPDGNFPAFVGELKISIKKPTSNFEVLYLVELMLFLAVP